MTSKVPIGGLLLAGGKSRRMGGGDKCLLTIAGETLLGRAIARARVQTAALALSINGDPARFEAYDVPVVKDVVPGHAGPLAGILSGMNWFADRHPEIEWIVSFATDAPFFPPDLVARLHAAVMDAKADLACAVSEGRRHPVFGLWPQRLRGELSEAVFGEELCRIDRWTGRYEVADVVFEGAPDPFFNINTADDFAAAESLTAQGAAA